MGGSLRLDFQLYCKGGDGTLTIDPVDLNAIFSYCWFHSYGESPN
jgi:hypothetical protein